MPDYVILHIYNNDSESEPLSPFDGPASYKVKDSLHFAAGVIRGMRRMLEGMGWEGEVHWNEWGRSWFPQDRTKETALEAAFIVKTMVEVSQEANVFAFWCISDIYDQCGFQAAEFEGHYGMLSLHGLRKPSWFAHQVLNEVGDERVGLEGGDELTVGLATRSEQGWEFLVAAYPERVGEEVERVRVRVRLPQGARGVELVRIGEEENNVVAEWRAMGAPEYPTRQELAALKAKNSLQSAQGGVEKVGEEVIFEVERPGVGLLKICGLDGE